MIQFQLHCFGVSHHHASVETRERLRFTLFDIRALMAASRRSRAGEGAPCAFAAIQEMVVLSTCNRVELYVRTEADAASCRTMLSQLIVEASREARLRAGLPEGVETPFTPEQIEEITYHHEGLDVARHLSRVACGLDSMILGETQILSQIKEAQENARASGLIGPVLAAVFHSAQRAGKKARTATAISSNPSSISSAAVALARSNTRDLSRCDVSVVGMGEMGQLALKMLNGRGAGRVRIVNRTRERAAGLAAHIQHNTGTKCVAHGLDELPQVLAKSDVVITATGAHEWIIDSELAARALKGRVSRELILVDIGVPRNVEPEVARLDGVRLFDMDDIHKVQDNALKARRDEIPKVVAIIDEEITGLEINLRKLRIRPLIDELRRKAEAIRQHELERTYHNLGEPDPETWSHVQRFSAALVQKLFHDPTMCIQQKAALESADSYAATIRELFGLPKKESSE